MLRCAGSLMLLEGGVYRSWRSQKISPSGWYDGSSSVSREATSSGRTMPEASFMLIHLSCLSIRCIAFTSSGLRNLISAMPAGSSTPPRACSAAYISMHRGLIVESMTTHAPPRISQCGGM